jgi:hypothetical protein
MSGTAAGRAHAEVTMARTRGTQNRRRRIEDVQAEKNRQTGANPPPQAKKNRRKQHWRAASAASFELLLNAGSPIPDRHGSRSIRSRPRGRAPDLANTISTCSACSNRKPKATSPGRGGHAGWLHQLRMTFVTIREPEKKTETVVQKNNRREVSVGGTLCELPWLLLPFMGPGIR